MRVAISADGRLSNASNNAFSRDDRKQADVNNALGNTRFSEAIHHPRELLGDLRKNREVDTQTENQLGVAISRFSSAMGNALQLHDEHMARRRKSGESHHHHRDLRRVEIASENRATIMHGRQSEIRNCLGDLADQVRSRRRLMGVRIGKLQRLISAAMIDSWEGPTFTWGNSDRLVNRRAIRSRLADRHIANFIRTVHHRNRKTHRGGGGPSNSTNGGG